jgi:hypothetical protein
MAKLPYCSSRHYVLMVKEARTQMMKDFEREKNLHPDQLGYIYEEIITCFFYKKKEIILLAGFFYCSFGSLLSLDCCSCCCSWCDDVCILVCIACTCGIKYFLLLRLLDRLECVCLPLCTCAARSCL